MQACGELPQLTADLPNLPVREAMAAIIRNKIDTDAAFRECAAKHKNLSEWIDAI